jgi:hypothetical protein
VCNEGRALQYVPEPLRCDKEVVMTAVGNDGRVLDWVTESLKNDKEVVMAAVGNNGCALQWTSMSLRNDKEVVMAAVCQWGHALQYAPMSLRNGKEVVMAAVGNDRGALQYASGSLLNDRFFVLGVTVAIVRGRHRWPILVSQVVRFNRDDMEFKRKFEPGVFTLTVDENFMNNDDDTDFGPQPTAFWAAVMNKRIK